MALRHFPSLPLPVNRCFLVQSHPLPPLFLSFEKRESLSSCQGRGSNRGHLPSLC